MTTVYSKKTDQGPQILTGDITMSSGWSATNIVLVKTGVHCLLSCYIYKNTSIVSGDIAMVLPNSVKVIDEMQSSTYTVAHGSAVGKVARVGIENGVNVTVRGPEASMDIVVFQISWLTS